ncbi:MAG: DMT family transporter [Bacillota bacterium]|nr:DMT family transporter [Bacillota bacterium]
MDEARSFSLVDVCLILTGVIWGVNNIVVKSALSDFSPLAFNAVRFTFASTVLCLIVLLTEKTFRVERRDIGRIVVTGILGNTLYQILYINGINLSTAGNVTVMLALMPVCVAILAKLFGGEDIPALGWAGILVSLAGVLVVALGSGAKLDFSSRTLRGDLLTFLGVFCWSAYTILTKPLVKKYSPARVTALTMVSGTICLVLYAIPYLRAQDWTRIRPASWAGLVSSASLALVFSYFAWSWGISRLGGARTAVYENIAMVSGVLSSWLILGEKWSAVRFAGALVTLFGVIAVRWSETLRRALRLKVRE